LHLAISSGHAGVVAALLEREAEVIEVWDFESESVPLQFAIKLKNIEMIEILLGHGADTADVTIPFEEDLELGLCAERTKPLTSAALQNDLTLLKYLHGTRFLLSGGEASGNYSIPLMYAVQNQNKEMILFLLDKGAMINPVDGNVSLVFGLAVSGASVDIILLLLANGAKVNDKDSARKTALEYAVK
jgi:ankyrin repeat protein